MQQTKYKMWHNRQNTEQATAIHWRPELDEGWEILHMTQQEATCMTQDRRAWILNSNHGWAFDGIAWTIKKKKKLMG